ncbi:MAG: YcgJ family protein [Achromobacter sp.]|uniref:YcgJ family protein n=1 Tax=Achromobacter sp. TaxID=134375 RepID=UPI003CFE7801
MCLILCLAVTSPGHAGPLGRVHSPARGVLCDDYLCADEHGISHALTERYLGAVAVAKLFLLGDFDLTEFTFSNGTFCSTKERLCRKDRYYDMTGKHSGAISERYTNILFGNSHPDP